MPPSAVGGGEPFPKRPRIGEAPPSMGQHGSAQPIKVTRAPTLPPVSAGNTTISNNDNNAAAGSSSFMEPSGDPMADAGLDTTATTTEEKKLLSEQDFVATLDKPEVTLQIRVPNDPTQMAWNFYGQLLSMTVDVMSVVKDVKSELSKTHLNGMPPNKILLKDPNGGFLSNTKTLAALNVGPTATFELQLKRRGGRN